MKVAFDIDDTLIVPRVATGLSYETPNYENIAIFRFFQAQGYAVGVWSGSGMDWAKTWAEKLGLKPDFVYVKEKRNDIDIAFDDCEVDLGKVNVRVKRINNGVSRKEWNARKPEDPPVEVAYVPEVTRYINIPYVRLHDDDTKVRLLRGTDTYEFEIPQKV